MSFTISINDQASFEVLFAGPAGPTGPQGIQGIQGVPGQGVAAGGTTGQVLKKLSSTNYDTGWSSDISGVAWGAITGTLSAQTDLQNALDAKLSTSAASSTYLPLAGGYMTGAIFNTNAIGGLYLNNLSLGAGWYTNVSWSGISLSGGSGPTAQSMTIQGDGITFATSPYKQTTPFLGLAGYATEGWVTSNFYPLTGNPSGFLTSAPVTSVAGKVGAVTLDNTDISGLGTLAVVNDAPSDGTIYGRKDGSWTSTISSVAWGEITGTLSYQLDLQTALNLKLDATVAATTYYLQTNPDGFITSAALTGYATETFVTTQGYITDAPSDGYTYGRLNGAWAAVAGGGVWGSITGTLGDQTDLATELGTKTTTNSVLGLISSLYTDIAFGQGGGPNIPMGRLLITDSPGDGSGDTFARVNFASSATFGSIVQDGDFGRDSPAGNFIYRNGATTYTIASQTYVNAQGFITSSALTPYAPLAGATFSGKVNTTITATTAPINIGSQLTAPTTTVAGDVWIGANINYKSWDGITKAVANTNTTNQFTQGQAISVDSVSNAFRIQQRGTGPAFVVEDQNPDVTPFVIDANGKVGVGIAPDATAAIKVDANGISFNGLVFNPTATAAHTGGPDTLDLLVTINGVNYRLGLRPA